MICMHILALLSTFYLFAITPFEQGSLYQPHDVPHDVPEDDKMVIFWCQKWTNSKCYEKNHLCYYV